MSGNQKQETPPSVAGLMSIAAAICTTYAVPDSDKLAEKRFFYRLVSAHHESIATSA